MAKLTSKQRKQLPPEDFGLPKEKKFPIHDENHVRSAIAYFHTCPDKDKKELANNINRAAKKFNMKIKLKKYSAFKPYADKEIISENANLILPDFISVQERQCLLMAPLEPYMACKMGIQTNDLINKAIKKFSDKYLETEYLNNGRINSSNIDDIFYDNDMKLTEKIINDFINSKEFNSEDIKALHDKNILSDLFKEFNDEIKCNFTKDLYDQLNSLIDETENDLISSIDNIVKNDDLSFDDFLKDYNIRKNYCNFTEDEIYFFINNHKIIEKLCKLTKHFLLNKYKFPNINVERFDNDIYYLYYLDLISGYYISGDNDNIDKSTLYNSAIKIDKDIYATCYVFRDKLSSNVVSIKVKDYKSDEYFNHIMNVFITNKYTQLPEMDINKITYSHSKCEYDYCLKM